MQARRRARLRSFPWRPRPGSACPASGPRPPASDGHSPARAPSGAAPGHPSGHHTPAASGNGSPRSRRSGEWRRWRFVPATNTSTWRSFETIASALYLLRGIVVLLQVKRHTSRRTTSGGLDQFCCHDSMITIEVRYFRWKRFADWAAFAFLERLAHRLKAETKVGGAGGASAYGRRLRFAEPTVVNGVELALDLAAAVRSRPLLAWSPNLAARRLQRERRRAASLTIMEAVARSLITGASMEPGPSTQYRPSVLSPRIPL